MTVKKIRFHLQPIYARLREMPFDRMVSWTDADGYLRESFAHCTGYARLTRSRLGKLELNPEYELPWEQN